MPKEKSIKKSIPLRHAPLGYEIEKPIGKLRPIRSTMDLDDDENGIESKIPSSLEAKIQLEARKQRKEMDELEEVSIPERSDNKQSFGLDEDDDDDADDTEVFFIHLLVIIHL